MASDSLLDAQQSFTLCWSPKSSLENTRSLKKPEQHCPDYRAENLGSVVQRKYPSAPMGVVTTGVWWNQAQLIVPLLPHACCRGQRTALYFWISSVSQTNPRKKIPIFSSSFFLACRALLQPAPKTCSSTSLSSFRMMGQSCLTRVSIMSAFLGLLRFPRKAKCFRWRNSLNCSSFTSVTKSLMGTPRELTMQLLFLTLRDRQSATKSLPQKQQSDLRMDPSSPSLNRSPGC